MSARLRIVVADDERPARAFLVSLLRSFDDAVVIGEAASGKEAVTMIEKERPDLALLDLKMPKVDGLEVLRAIKQDDKMRAMPVVMLTSSREERDLVETYRLGVNSYIVKPVDFEQFTESARALGMYWLLLNRPPKAA